MGRAPCCDKANVKKGPWSPEEDAKLKDFIEKFGTAGNWIALPQKAGLKRCGKSCRLRWLNYLRPNIRHGEFSDEEDRIICTLYASIGSRWSIIAAQLPGRTDNDIKNYWNTKLKKKLFGINNIQSSNQISKISPPPFFPNSQPLSSQLSQLYNSFYTQATKSFTNSISPPQNFLYSNSNNNNNNYNLPSLTSQCSYNYQPNLEGSKDLEYNYYPDHVKQNMLMFGGNNNDQGSCSSSDGSCKLGHVTKQEDHHQMDFISNIGALEENHQKFVLYNGNNGDHEDLVMMSSFLDQKANGVLLDNNNLLLFNDENKRDEKGMYYF